MGSLSLLRDPATMSDAELLAEARILDAAEDQTARSDPASLLCRTMPTYRRRLHLQLISREMKRLAAGEFDRLLIMMPPQSGKTVTAVVGGSNWWLVNHPGHRIIIGSYGNALANDRGRDCKRFVQDHGHRWDLYLARGSESVQDWRLTTGGGVRSVGIGAGIAGYPGDIAFIDDPHKSRQEADSLRYRDRTENWLSADITSRLAPGAPMVLVMTPWHVDDLSVRVVAQEGRVEDGGRWRVIRMPAFCDDPENDPLGRAMGEPLPHPRIPVRNKKAARKHWEAKRSASTVQDWFSLYMCDAKPAKGALLTRELLRLRRCYAQGSACHPCNSKPTRAAVAVDPSGGGRDTAGIIGGYLGDDNRLYISHDVTDVMSSDEWPRAACKLAVDIDADMIIVETNFGGDMGTRLVRTAWQALQREEQDKAAEKLLAVLPDMPVSEVKRRIGKMRLRFSRLCPRVKAVVARKNKRLRADPIAQQWTEDLIRTAAYLPELEEEWATWQVGSTDSPGRIDASVYLAYALLPIPISGTGGAAAPSGTIPTTSASPLDRGGQTGGFGPLGG